MGTARMRSLARVATVPASVSATLTEPEIWANLAQYAEDARGAFSASTERALRSDVASFTRWCGEQGHQAMPATKETVVRFVDAMAASKAPATVRRYVSSIATFHRAAEVANPCEAQAVKLALKRMHNAKGRAQQQAAPLNEGLVRKLLDARGTRLRDLRNRALLVISYVTLCRRSELVALQVSDLTVEPDGFGTVLIRRSKGDQEGRGAIVPIPADAMRYLAKWIEAARITDGALFRAVRYSGSVGGSLDPGDVSRAFKEMARRAGLSADAVARISGHSSRVGAASDMLRYKESLPGIMAAGRWKSPEMVGRYTAKVGARESAAKRIADQREPF
jgi:site-specific recombinase XerD